MTGFSVGCWIVINLCITYGCYLVCSWANHYLFEYLGDAEINGEWKMCYSYHLLTIPARIFAMLAAVGMMFVAVCAWGSFIGLVVLQERGTKCCLM